jgi:Mrp family chromosome partitioning ATPase
MRQVVNFVLIVVIAVVPAQFGMPVGHAAAEPVSFSQVIRPLQCSVDIIAVGPRVNVRLVPNECMRSPDARQLLADTRALLHNQ